ncbi:hypothetical protein TIFTF001_033922 [Ficus carica]|uniref:Uncharacterized protein n=1 Tax=Ficus carica TaxID=3494 RepID=A0AA88J877_FICCA|nr:hypothetical protein TIFTF001_033922 [Ficus carica]
MANKFSRVVQTCHEGGFGPWFELDQTGRPNHCMATCHEKEVVLAERKLITYVYAVVDREASTSIQRYPRHDNLVTSHEASDFRKTLASLHRLYNNGHKSPFGVGRRGRKWLLQLLEFDITCIMPKVIKSQAVIDLIAQFNGNNDPRAIDELLGKLPENTCAIGGEFSIKEPTLAPYRTITQKLIKQFEKVIIENTSGSNNCYADALATLGSILLFSRDAASIVVSRRNTSIIEILEESLEDSEGYQVHWRTPIKETLLLPKKRRKFEALKRIQIHDSHRRLVPEVI